MAKRKKSTICKMQGGENLTYMQNVKKQLLPWDDMSVTHLMKTPNQKNKYIRTTQRSLKKETQVPTEPRIGKKRTKLGKKGPKSL
jgi:hypothetical protein